MAKIKGQLESAQLENLTSDPANLPEGRAWVETTASRAKIVVGATKRTVVTEDQTQTLSGKTLITPNITTPTVSGGTFTSPSISDPTLTKDGFALSIPSLTAPSNVVLTDVQQAITNKDIDGGTASNNRRLTIPKDTIANLQALTRKQGTIVFDTSSGRPYIDDGTSLNQIGSGGAGSINLIDNGDAELTTNIFSGYTSSVVGSRPAGTQTAGAANLTFNRTTTNPLYKTASWEISKAAVNAQGQNGSIPFTVPLAFRAKSVKASFDYIVTSGTFQAGTNFGTPVDSDLIWYIYDVTNNTFIEPSNIRMLSNSTTISNKFEAEFQTSATGSSYRLIGHVATTSAAAWTIVCDNFAVSPNEYVLGSGQLENIIVWQTAGSNTTNAGSDTLVNLQAASGSLGTYTVSAGAVRVKSSGKFKIRIKAEVGANSEAVTLKVGVNGVKTSGRSHIVDINASGSNSHFDDTFYFDLVAGDLIDMYILNPNARLYRAAELEIVQLTGPSLQMSDQTTTRIVDFVGGVTTATALTANVTNIPLTASKDSHGAWNTNFYDVKVAGDYYVSATVINSSGSGTLLVYVDGSFHKAMTNVTASTWSSGSLIIPNLRVGQTISFREDASVTISGSASAAFSIMRISGPNQIAARETIAASYWLSANQALTANVTPINFDSKEFDYIGAVTTGASWRFSPQSSGLYEISFFGLPTTSAGYIYLYKNGVKYKSISFIDSGNNVFGTGPAPIQLKSDDYIELRASVSFTLNGGSLSADPTAKIYIKRVGL